MNLDRLLKLLKLANHNPNDAEANSAARAACKMLMEDNYKWIESTKRLNGNSSRPESSYATSAKTWNDVHRSDKAWWSSTRKEYGGRGWEGFEEDAHWGEDTGFNWEQYFTDQERRRQERANQARREYQEKRATSWTWEGERSGSKGYKKVYVQRCRDCSVCKITRLTTDEENPYVCYACKTKV